MLKEGNLRPQGTYQKILIALPRVRDGGKVGAKVSRKERLTPRKKSSCAARTGGYICSTKRRIRHQGWVFTGEKIRPNERKQRSRTKKKKTFYKLPPKEKSRGGDCTDLGQKCSPDISTKKMKGEAQQLKTEGSRRKNHKN